MGAPGLKLVTRQKGTSCRELFPAKSCLHRHDLMINRGSLSLFFVSVKPHPGLSFELGVLECKADTGKLDDR